MTRGSSRFIFLSSIFHLTLSFFWDISTYELQKVILPSPADWTRAVRGSLGQYVYLIQDLCWASFLAVSLVVVLASVVDSENRLIKLIDDIFLVSFLLWLLLSFSVTKWSDRDILLLYSSVVILCSFLISHLNFSTSVFPLTSWGGTQDEPVCRRSYLILWLVKYLPISTWTSWLRKQ